MTLNADGSGLIVNSSGYSMDFYTKKGGAGHSCSLADLPKIPIYKAGTYTFSVGTVSAGWIILLRVDDDGKVSELGKLYGNRESLTFTFDANTRVTMRRSVNTSGTYYTNIMVEKGDNATSYSPYKETNTPILSAEAVATLDCYGAGVNEATNRIYQQGNKWYYEQRIDKIDDISSLGWGIQNGCFVVTIAGIRQYSGYEQSNLLCIDYQAGISTYRDSVAEKTIVKVIGANNQIAIKDSIYTNVTDFKNAISGELYYELAEPIVTDVTNLVTFTPIETEAGSTITFANTENLAIPIKYQLEYATLLKEVARYE